MRATLGKGIAFGMVVLALSFLPAQAEGPSWTYVEAGYLNIDTDNLDESGDNYFLGASVGVGWFHANGYYTTGDIAPDIEQDLWRIGLGWHGLLGDRADLLGEAAYIDFSVDEPGFENSETGYRLTAGIRWRPIGLFEADAFAHYTDFDEETDTSWELRGILFIWRLGFGASMEQLDDSEQWNAFIRFNIGK